MFCARCHARQQAGRSRAVALLNPAYARGAHHSGAGHGRPLTRRVILEAMMMTAVSVLALLALLNLTNRSLSFASNSTIVSFGIDAGKDPQQRPSGVFEASMDYDGSSATFTGDTTYSISARVEGVKPYQDAISPAVPYDLLLSWGQLADTGVAGTLKWEQSDRRGQVSGSLANTGNPGIDSSYVISHVSNNHIVPANNSIRQALATIKPGDLVRIDGHLVDIRMVSGNKVLSAFTSKSRTDQGDGACEIIYAEHIRVNQTTY